MEILNGKALSAEIKNKIKLQVQEDFVSKNKPVPTLACMIVGENPASQIYVASKEKACATVGFNSVVVRLPENSSEEEVIEEINKLNNDEKISAILLQLPLPNGLDERKIISHISPEKDADGLTDVSLGRLFAKTYSVAPCTAMGIIDLIKSSGLDISGKRAVVIGRSLLVGKSVAVLLEEHNATVTVCHSRTQNLEEITKTADILVVAIGKPKYVTAEMVKAGAVVIDVGINRIDGKILGDVDYENVSPKCSYITPVPGGVGPMTIAELLSNTLTLHKLKTKGE
ncbi:MAG: bifunctional methylenetetrahydrofolate dehydrogenase/methenyltetrahydrofolate cyclohydrolase FolD [Clostridia bacterium]|nr:bifunctional methylenetetrahydrofolate dehydrogenase/methenyltetrahydrofolate cyclohydrolase FolD [Clostridia bacterium]